MVNFDVKAAIEVCRHVALDDALYLAEKHGYHEWFLAIQIEDRKNYNIALKYIAKLNFEQVSSFVFSSILLLKVLCDIKINELK